MPQLEQVLCRGGQVEPLDGPAGSILKCLMLSSGELVLELAAAIFYLLGALTGEQSTGGQEGIMDAILGIPKPSQQPPSLPSAE